MMPTKPKAPCQVEGFNPAWTYEQAKVAHDRACSSDPSRWADPTLPLFRYDAMQRLAKYERQFAKGDRYMLLLALRVCANHDLPMPGWLARAFIKAFDAVHNLRARTWDEVFGKPPIPERKHLHRLRDDLILPSRVWRLIDEIRTSEPKTAIDEHLFARVGAKLHIGKTRVAEYYYAVKRSSEAQRPE